jgi:hypothetical protein
MSARLPRRRPTGERPQNSDDGEEKNGIATLVVYSSLVVHCRKTIGAAFYSTACCGYLSAAVERGARARRDIGGIQFAS